MYKFMYQGKIMNRHCWRS